MGLLWVTAGRVSGSGRGAGGSWPPDPDASQGPGKREVRVSEGVRPGSGGRRGWRRVKVLGGAAQKEKTKGLRVRLREY